MADFDNDDAEGDVASAAAAAAFDPVERTLHASIQFYAQQQLYQHVRQAAAVLDFWRCFALSKSGEAREAITGLDALLARAEGAELGLPVVALLLSTHSSLPAKDRDKRAMLELKTKLKVVSKSSGEAALLLAGRYFLYTNKVPKARQCIEKLISKNKKDVALLSLFGWIYLLSGEEKYVEKSMAVFKKAAKLSLPNFDIAALMGRAKYFECDPAGSNIPKCLQAIDSVLKIYPAFAGAHEEKIRILAAQGKWDEVKKAVEKMRSKRTEGGESITAAFVAALESFTTKDSSASHAQALKILFDTLNKEEGSSAPNAYWLWQYAQLFLRLARGGGRGAESVLTQISQALSTASAAFANQKGGPGILLAFEAALVSFRLGDSAAALAGFGTVSQAALVAVGGGGAEEGDDAAAAGGGAAGKVNEDERWVKAQAAVHVALVLLSQKSFADAAASLDALPAEVASYTSPQGEPAPLPSLLYARASLALSHSRDNASAARLLREFIQAHSLAIAGRAPSDGTLNTSASNATQGINRFFMLLDPLLLVQASRLLLQLLLPSVDASAPSLDASLAGVKARPVAETFLSLEETLGLFVASLSNVVSLIPGHAEAWGALAVIQWACNDSAGALASAGRAEALTSSAAAQTQLKRVLAMGGSGASISPAAKPIAAASTAAASSRISMNRKVSKPKPTAAGPSGAESEAGLNFDDDDDDEADAAAFKAPNDAAAEAESRPLASPGANFAASRLGSGSGASFNFTAVSAPSSATAPPASALSGDELAEAEAQALLDEIESRSGFGSAKRQEELRAQALLKSQQEADRKRAREEEMRRAAEQEASLALERASKAEQRLAEVKKQEEIAALRLAREAEKKRQMDEIDRAEREREEQREIDRQERLRKQAALDAHKSALAAGGVATPAAQQQKDPYVHTRLRSFDDTNNTSVTSSDGMEEITSMGNSPAAAASAHSPPPATVARHPSVNTNLKWNGPTGGEGGGGKGSAPVLPESSPIGASSPLSLVQSPHGTHPAGSPLSVPHVSLRAPGASPTNNNAIPTPTVTSIKAAASSSADTAADESPAPSPKASSAASTAMVPASASASASAAAAAAAATPMSNEARLAAEKKEKIVQAGLQIEQAKKFTKVAFWGEVFLKHGRRGNPHERNVTLEVTGSELKFDWSSGQLKAHKSAMQLVEGKGTPVFARPTAAKTPPERCFSIVTATRTLDLEAPSDQARDYCQQQHAHMR